MLHRSARNKKHSAVKGHFPTSTSGQPRRSRLRGRGKPGAWHRYVGGEADHASNPRPPPLDIKARTHLPALRGVTIGFRTYAGAAPRIGESRGVYASLMPRDAAQKERGRAQAGRRRGLRTCSRLIRRCALKNLFATGARTRGGGHSGDFSENNL